MIEESLDVALSKTAIGFDEKHYEKVQTAYRLLGKTQVTIHYCNIPNPFTKCVMNGFIILGCLPIIDPIFSAVPVRIILDGWFRNK